MIRLASNSALKLESVRSILDSDMKLSYVNLMGENAGPSFNEVVGGVEMPLSHREILSTANLRLQYLMDKYRSEIDTDFMVLESGLIRSRLQHRITVPDDKEVGEYSHHVTFGLYHKASTGEITILISTPINIPLPYYQWCLAHPGQKLGTAIQSLDGADIPSSMELAYLTGNLHSRLGQLQEVVRGLFFSHGMIRSPV